MKPKIYLLVVCLTLSSSAFTQDAITAKDAAKLLNAKGTVIIDCNKADEYNRVHIANAINIWHEDLCSQGAVQGILKMPDELARIFSSKGVSNSSTILLYDAGSNMFSGRMYWVLKYLGAKDVKIICGGISEWQKNRLPVSSAAVKLPPATFHVLTNHSIFASITRVKQSLNNPKVVLVDVRDLNEYTGKSGTTKRKGSIPGAIHLDYRKVQNQGGLMKSKEELEALFTSAGITPDKEIILYCSTSVRTGIVFMALKSILNYPSVRVFEGAFNQWEADESNPIE